MHRIKRWAILALVILLVSLSVVPTRAQGDVQAQVIPDSLNVRERPASEAPVIGQLARGVTVGVTGRDGTVWVYAAALDGGIAGWVHWDYLDFPDGFDVYSLPVIQATGESGSAPQPEAQPIPALVEGGVSGVTVQGVNFRAGPGTDYPAVRLLFAGTSVALVGRSDDASWLQAEFEGQTGWLYAPLVRVSGDVGALPVATSTEQAEQPAAAAAPGVAPGVVPVVGGRARTIYLRGQALDNRAGVFSKVGDSITDMPMFLDAIGAGQQQLGDYAYLQAVIDHFSWTPARAGNSFGNVSAAARGGWTSHDLLDPSKNFLSGVCREDETPLACEYRVSRPAVALIMIGTNDILYQVDSASYRANLEDIVQTSIDMGVIPVLSTIPDNLTGPEGSARVLEFNDMIRSVAAEYGVPLWDYWLALQTLPNKGMAADNYHPSFDPAPGTTAIFTPEHLQYGFNVRNLTALMALDAVWKGAMY